MARFSWIWLVGSLVWVADGLISARLRNQSHAALAFLLALVFLAAGLFYRQQPPRK